MVRSTFSGVHSPLEECVKRIMGRNDAIDEAKASAIAKKTNKWRAEYYNFFTDKQWGDAKSYDLTLDSSTLFSILMMELSRVRYIVIYVVISIRANAGFVTAMTVMNPAFFVEPNDPIWCYFYNLQYQKQLSDYEN